MKVKELAELLDGANPEAEIILSSDSEGNNYSPLSEFEDDMVYDACYRHSGDIHIAKLTEERKALGFSEEDLYDEDDAVPAIVFYPLR